MSLDQNDLNAIQSLLLPIENRIIGLESTVQGRFNYTDQNFDHLFKQNEVRETEYLVISNQIKELESRVLKLEREVER